MLKQSIRTILLASLAVSLAGNVNATGRTPPTVMSAQTPATIEPPALPTIPDPFAGRVVQMEGGVTATTDVVYSTIPGYRPLLVDIYRAKSAKPQPLVIYVHGGGWMIGHRRASVVPGQDMTQTLAGLAARGFVVSAISYRFSKEAPFPAALDDLGTAIRFLRANAAEYGIDPSRIGVWGGSAGAQLAVMQGVRCVRPLSGDDRANGSQSDCVQAAVGWYGPYDFRTWPEDMAPDARNAYLGCAIERCSAARLAEVSAITFVDRKDPPVLLISGSEDTTVPSSQSLAMAEAMKAAGAPYKLEIIPGVGHGWKTPESDRRTAAMDQALGMTFGFFEEHLKGRD